MEFLAPRYEDLALVNVLPSVTARLDGDDPVIAIPRASQYVVLLVDGLGWHQLVEYADHAETMAGLLRTAPRITCSVPSTTATSLTSLGCGVPTGEHGVTRDAVRNATRKKYPKMERAIAAKIGLRPEDIWPERYAS